MKIRAAIRDDFHDIHRLLIEVHQLHHKNRPDVYRDSPRNKCVGLDEVTHLVLSGE